MESRQHEAALHAIVDSLRRIIQAIRLSSSIAQDTLGITGAQLFVLQQIADQPGASLREVADRTLTDQSSVSVVVSRVVEAGYVARRTSTSDARRTELTLTPAGHALLRRAPDLAQTRLVDALHEVPAGRLRITAAVLGGVARAISPTTEPPPMFFEPERRRRAARRRPAKPAAKRRQGKSR